MATTMKDLLQRGAKGEKLIGGYIMNPAPFVIETMKMAGYDFVILDLEHERMTMTEISQLIYVCEACGMATQVRVPNAQCEELMKKALDAGASCIKVPDIRTVEDAKNMVKWCKFPPLGHRGACPFVRGNGYGSDVKGCWEKANQKTALSALIEGPEGIANMEEIIAVDGIDCVSIGQVDLSVTLGVPGQTFHEKVIEAVLKAADICLKYGKQLSVQIRTPEDIKLYKNHPAITQYHTDNPPAIFYRACKQLCDGIREESAKAGK